MKLLVDMNLSPDWAPLLNSCGWEAVHWKFFQARSPAPIAD
jgi:predicted nuclease of predicted toxin-antitoxin system